MSPRHFWIAMAVWVGIDIAIFAYLWARVKLQEPKELAFTPEQIQLDSDWSEMIDQLNRQGFTSRPPLPDDSDQEAFHLDAPQPPRAA